jgi:hypothetical protein
MDEAIQSWTFILQKYDLNKPLCFIKFLALIFCYSNRKWVNTIISLLKPLIDTQYNRALNWLTVSLPVHATNPPFRHWAREESWGLVQVWIQILALLLIICVALGKFTGLL